MKKYFGKVVSSFLVLVMVFSIGSAFAVNTPSDYNTPSIFEYDGVYYYSQDNGHCIVSMAAYPNGNTEVVIREINNNQSFRRIVLQEDIMTSADYASLYYWENILKKAEAAPNDIVNIPSAVVSPQMQTYAGGTTPFYDFLEEVYGAEYTGEYVDSISTYPRREVTEDLAHLVTLKMNVTLKEAMSTASVLTGVLGLKVKDGKLAAIAVITGAIAHFLPAGTELDYYAVSAEYSRVGWCGGQMWNYEQRTISYDGFVGELGSEIDIEDVWDMESNKFSYPERIMEDAYLYWNANN